MTGPDNIALACIFGCNQLQCDAFITWFFFSKMIALTGGLLCVFCRFNLWFITCPRHCIDVWNILLYWPALSQRSTVFLYYICHCGYDKRLCSWTAWPSDSFSDTEATDVVMHTHPHGKNGTSSAHVPIIHISDELQYWGPFHKRFFARNSNSMEISPCCNSVDGHQIATNFCTCHDSTAVVPCTIL